jgi:hypothetical protein
MATVADTGSYLKPHADVLSGTPRAHAIDRWIYVSMAVLFIMIVLLGFIPDSIAKIAAVQAGHRPPFPLVMHVHALLMGSFLLLLLAQTSLVATGRCALHMQLGLVAVALVPALVVAGSMLAATNYHTIWHIAHSGPPAARAAASPLVPLFENILLLQIRIGILFALFIAVGLMARARNAGFHKRMMILATAVTLPAAFDRMEWLPTTFPQSPLASDLYVLLAVAPMFAWDVYRNRRIHSAWTIWFAGYVVAAAMIYAVWDTPWWHATARALMGV